MSHHDRGGKPGVKPNPDRPAPTDRHLPPAPMVMTRGLHHGLRVGFLPRAAWIPQPVIEEGTE